MNQRFTTEDAGEGGDGADPMQKLKREHAECLVFAEKIIEIAEKGSDGAVAEAVEKVAMYNAEELEPHLQHEEQAILRALVEQHREHLQLCITIGREHGQLRTLAEHMDPRTARADLAEFGRLLRDHTQLEDRELFPLVERLFSPEQMAEIVDFVPLLIREPMVGEARRGAHGSTSEEQGWLAEVRRHFERVGRQGASIVLFPRYSPEHVEEMASGLGLQLFDVQKEVMERFGQEADSLELLQLDESLRGQARDHGIVSHNVEALLSVKSGQERRAWLRSFLDAAWPNAVVLPITLYQADVPEDHLGVCDLELHILPR